MFTPSAFASFSSIAASASEKARPMRCGISSWKGDAAHKCRLPVQVNIRSFHRDVAEADLFLHAVVGLRKRLLHKVSDSPGDQRC